MGSTKPEHIQLKESIAGTLGDQRAITNSPGRTAERDKAAQWLIENVLDEGLWPLSYGKLAEMSDWSAGHWRNTFERYFEAADTGHETEVDMAASTSAGTAAETLNTGNMSIDVPDTVTDMPSFIAGISVGYKLAKDEEQ